MADRKLKIDIRRGKILEHLRKSGKVSVTELSQELGATAVTIRNDLSTLERDGYLIRVQGGAVASPERGSAMTPQNRDVANLEAKLAIAAEVAGRVKDGNTLFINSGTTSVCVANALKVRKNLNIVTNSLKVATELGSVSSFRVILLGGVINSQYGFTSGDDAQQQLGRYQADWAILSVDGISARGGITTYHAEEATIDRMMLMGAKSILVVADSSKIGNPGFSRVCDCSQRLNLITDTQADPQILAELQELGVDVISV